MTASDARTEPPDVDRIVGAADGGRIVGALARSMLALHGGHDDDDHPAESGNPKGAWSKAPDFAADPARAAAVREATDRDKERYLTAGLTPIDCRFCHATVAVKKLGPEYTAVQWNSEASQRCATFAEMRAGGGDSSRTRSCPRLSDSIKHAVAEGCLDEASTAPSPGDG